MLTFILALAAFAATETADTAMVKDGGYELISKKRELSALESAVEPKLQDLGQCKAHTGGLDYGELTVSFMVDKKGKPDNASVRSGYVLPKPLIECLTEPISDLDLGRGDVAVAKFVLTLPR